MIASYSISYLLSSRRAKRASWRALAQAVTAKWQLRWRVKTKALNRENRLECIRQSIRVRFDYRLRALVETDFWRVRNGP